MKKVIFKKDRSPRILMKRVGKRVVFRSVFSIMILLLVLLFASSLISAAFGCTTGTVDTTCTLNSTYTFYDGEIISGVGNLIIQDRGSIANYTRVVNSHGVGVIINFSTITILAGGNISGGNITLYANNLSLVNGTLYAEGLGYLQTSGPGAGGNAADYGGGGAGYGGKGGRGYYGSYKGAAGNDYGSSFFTNNFGSGGGRTVSEASTGGNGGGTISLFLSDTFLLNGTINVDGTAGLYRSGGGGSGGSVYVNTNIFSGNGRLTSRGGNGLGDTVTYGGGGSGGRISVWYNQSSFTNYYNSSVQGGLGGGSSSENGWNGTMIFMDKDDNSAVIVSGFKFQGTTTNANESMNTTFWNSNSPNWYNFSSLNLINVRVISNQLFIINITAINLSMDNNSSIDLTGKGYTGTLGPGAGGTAAWGGSGGGNGGRGGRGYYGGIQSSIGRITGSSLIPTTFGSGGGRSTNDGNSVGGTGGGVVILNVLDTFNFNGTIISNGGPGFYRDGGGAGGSIYVSTNILSGTGLFRANGGNGWGDVVAGGGGSGGRIAVYYNYSSYFGINSSTVLGGSKGAAGAEDGEKGSLIFVDVDNNSAILASGFRFQGMSTIANESATPQLSFWSPTNPSLYNFSTLNIISGTQVYQETSMDLSYLDHQFVNFNWKCYGYNYYNSNYYIDYPTLIILNITANNLTLDINSTIDLSSCGYLYSTGPGTSGTCYANSCGGASHGGYGGRGSNNNGDWPLPGYPYGSSLFPNTFGSGAKGPAGSNPGGRGGGIIRLDLSDTLNLSGNITVNGEMGISNDGIQGAGGGAGGSIYARTKNLIGIGKFLSVGGVGSDYGSYEGGGGSGGRIAVYYNLSNFNFSGSSVMGGRGGNYGSENGGNGSLIFVDEDDNAVIFVNGFRFQGVTSVANETINTTFWNSASPTVYNFTNLTILSGTQIFQSVPVNLRYTYSNFTNFNWVCYGRNFYNINYFIYYPSLIWLNISATNLTLDQNSFIDLSSCGYAGSAGPGTPASCPANACGGAGHGSYGGRGSNNNGDWRTPGYSYGSSLAPNTFGSGGGTPSGTYPGGRGGGIIKIELSDTLNLEGDIKSNGELGISNSVSYGAGGGAGGSIYIRTKNIMGAGRFSSMGGNGYDGGSYEGGGGSGGRIAVYYNNSIFYQLSSTVLGGTGGNLGSESGGKGSLIFVDEDNNSATITQSFRFQGATTIANETINNTFWNSANPALYNFSNLNILSGAQVFQASSMTLTYSNHSFTNFNWTCYGNNFYNSNYYINYPTLITLNILAQNLTLDQNSRIDLASCGYAGSSGPGTPSSCSANACGGASYGGIGGRGSNNGGLTPATAAVYGNYKRPLDFGSGGGTATSTNPGGRGGGVIKLDIYDTLNLSGYLGVNGEKGLSDSTSQGSGGGSGGSIYLRAKNLVGLGKISSVGGNGYDGGSYEGGGGSGGRIFVFYGTSNFNYSNITVAGGLAGNYGSQIGGNGSLVYTSMPLIGYVNLTATNSSLNDTYQNISASFISIDGDNDDITYIYNWYKDDILNATTLITNDLVAYYPLDNNSLDYYNSNNGTSFNTSIIPGKIKNSFNFDGASSRVDMNAINIGSGIGIAFDFWAKINSTGNTKSFFQYGLDPGSNQNFIRLGFHDDGGVNKLRLWTQTGTAAYDNYYGPNVVDIPDGWNHYYLEWSGTTKKLYINSVQVPLSVWQRTSPTSLSNLNTNQVFKLGYALASGTNYSYAGQVDEFMIFNRTLSEEEIGRIYRAGLYSGNLIYDSQTFWNENWSISIIPHDYNGPGLETTSSKIKILDLTLPISNLKLPINDTYVRNGTNINFTSNFSDDSSGIKNITLHVVNSTGQEYYTESVSYAQNTFFSTVGISISIVEGIYNWFYSIFDWAGNLFISENRTITADFTYPIINLVYPTPDNDVGKSSFFEINATINEINLANVSLHFNGTIRNYNRSFENLSYLGNNLWNIFLTQTGLVTGQSYSYYLTAEDYAANINSSEVRIVNGNTAPNITAMTQYPNSSDAIDPGVEIYFNVNVSDSDDNFDSVIIELKNRSGDIIQTRIMSLISGNSSIAFLNGSITLPMEEGNYTYRIRTNDTLGAIYYSQNYGLSSFWDCSWVIEKSGLEGADAYGYYQDKVIGNITIRNTGNSNFADNNCNLTFTNSYSRNTFSGTYWTSPNWYSSKSGLQFSEESINVLPGENKTFQVFASFPTARIEENPMITIVSNLNSSLTGNNTAVLPVRMTISPPGPYLRQGFLTNPIISYLTIALNTSLSAYVENVAGNGSEINNAYNVSFNWELPLNFNYDGNTSINYSVINTSNRLYQNINLSLDSVLLVDMKPGIYEFKSNSYGYDGLGDLLIDANNNTLLNSSINISFECYSAAQDGICVLACVNLSANLVIDPDCDIDIVRNIIVAGTTAAAGGGGGGGASSGPTVIKSEANYELVRGGKQNFQLEVKNKYGDEMRNIKISAAGLNSEYISISPDTIDSLAPGAKKNVTVTISAPSYFSGKKYDLIFDITGNLVSNATSGAIAQVTDKRYVTLYIVEVDRKDATTDINQSKLLIDEMNKSGLILKEVQSLLLDQIKAYGDLNFLGVKTIYDQIKKIRDNAIESKQLIEELTTGIAESEKNGVLITESKKSLYLAEVAFNRGDYALALERLKEAKLVYALEIKGEYNLIYTIKNNPGKSFGIVIFVGLFGWGSSLLIRLRLYKRKLKNLGEEEVLLLELMKMVQRQCFEEKRMSMEEYDQAMIQYESKLSETIENKIRTETKIANLLKARGKRKALDQEKARLIELIRKVQDDYLNKNKIETRIYEGMIKSYSTRLTDVDEQLAYVEAQEALKKQSKINGMFKV